jgi:hypothetical protein
MKGIPFDDLLAELERDPKDTALALMDAIKLGECPMGDVLYALRYAASHAERAARPAVVERQIAAIENGIRYIYPVAYDTWIAENGPVSAPHAALGIQSRVRRKPDGGETIGGAFWKVVRTGAAAGIAVVALLLLLGEVSVSGLIITGFVTAFAVGYMAMFLFFGYSEWE